MFRADYSWLLDPELPGGGAADSVPAVEVGHGSAIAHNLLIEPEGGDPWIAAVRDGGYGWGFSVRTTPDPATACVLAGGVAYLIHTAERSWRVIAEFVTQIEEATEVGLVLLADATALRAVGEAGLVWESERLALDDLQILAIDRDRIECSGVYYSDRMTFTVSAVTGDRIAGDPFTDPFRPRGRRRRRRA